MKRAAARTRFATVNASSTSGMSKAQARGGNSANESPCASAAPITRHKYTTRSQGSRGRAAAATPACDTASDMEGGRGVPNRRHGGGMMVPGRANRVRPSLTERAAARCTVSRDRVRTKTEPTEHRSPRRGPASSAALRSRGSAEKDPNLRQFEI